MRRNHEATRPELDADALEEAEQEVARQEELARVYRVSERLLRERNLLTFGAQLAESVAVLRDNAELRAQMRDQFRYILVDEFQDTNIAQLELLWLLAGERRNIVAVGDDDQAIYRFRGASFGSFTIFLERFCGVTGRKSAPKAGDFLVSLSQNYRSTQRILRVAGELIQHNEKSPLLPTKNLTTENREGEKVRIAEFATSAEEAQWVADEIERLHEKGVSWKSFAVLYRKHTHRTDLLAALRRKEIPFVIRKFSILTSTLVKDLFAWLRIIEKRGDNVAFARVLGAPYWGLEPKDLVRLAERAAKTNAPSMTKSKLPKMRRHSTARELASVSSRRCFTRFVQAPIAKWPPTSSMNSSPASAWRRFPPIRIATTSSASSHSSRNGSAKAKAKNFRTLSNTSTTSTKPAATFTWKKT